MEHAAKDDLVTLTLNDSTTCKIHVFGEFVGISVSEVDFMQLSVLRVAEVLTLSS
jgi:hypothetical protein